MGVSLVELRFGREAVDPALLRRIGIQKCTGSKSNYHTLHQEVALALRRPNLFNGIDLPSKQSERRRRVFRNRTVKGKILGLRSQRPVTNLVVGTVPEWLTSLPVGGGIDYILEFSLMFYTEENKTFYCLEKRFQSYTSLIRFSY